MKKLTAHIFLSLLAIAITSSVMAQKQPIERTRHRCLTMEKLEEAVRNNPGLTEQWRIKGEQLLQLRPQKAMNGARLEGGEIIIPVVFHFVDDSAHQAWITDRDFYEQVEILNRDYSGKKLDQYLNVVPQGISSKVGKVNIRFTLARRTPAGNLTSGIERRAIITPSRTDIKKTSANGLDPWDESKYLNVWVGTFTGNDNGLLGIATFPFLTTEGPQGVVIGTGTLPFTSPTTRSYYKLYSEGATLSHEVGHYFYLYHAFGDQTNCNNADFRLQSGWPLANGAGTEGDDTPTEGMSPFGIDVYYGNPSMSYTMGCVTTPIMYGNFMNYYDDRALFMFSDGQRKRIESCINLYRPGLLTTDGATPPVAVTDAFLVNLSTQGSIERRAFIAAQTPIQAILRNNGTTTLTSVTVNTIIDNVLSKTQSFAINLPAGQETALTLDPVSTTDGNHTYKYYLSTPNNIADNFPQNDTIYSFVNINTSVVTAPFTDDFSGSFPGQWRIWNPNSTSYTWTKTTTSGFAAAGAATVLNFNYPTVGDLDELVSPPLNFGTKDSSTLSFRVAYTVLHDPSNSADSTDPSVWDGLEVYVSPDGGANYNLVYKKTGKDLQTYSTAIATSFAASTSQQERWRLETINLTPYIIPGQKMLVRFRNTAAYGNNIYLDDVAISAVNKPTIDMTIASINGVNDFGCTPAMTPTITVKNVGIYNITSYKLNYSIDNGAITTIANNNVNLAPGQTANINLGSKNFAPGNHLLTAYVSEPNNTADLNPSNDTTTKAFTVFTQVTAPFAESFEGSFPPNGWGINNPDKNITWSKTTQGVWKINASDSASAMMRSFSYAASNAVDELYSPIVTYTNVDSVFLRFDLGAAGYVNNTQPKDTLEILITRDCGSTFQSIYKKWGTDLQTAGVSTSEFKPGATASLWRKDSVSLLPYLGTSSSFQVVFRNTHNQPGNDLYLDNVNITTRNVPTLLKQQGYLILPTVTNSQFGVWHYEQPTTLRTVQVFNSIGQLVWAREYSGNAEKYIHVDLSGKAAGIYFVSLTYDNMAQKVSQRVVKY